MVRVSSLMMAVAIASLAGTAAADDAVGPLLAPAPPSAIPPAPAPWRDRLGPAVDVSFGGGLFTGEIADQARDSSLLYRLGAGLSRGPWAVLMSANLYMLGDLSEPRTMGTTVSYLGVGVEPSIRRELTTGPGVRVHMRLGYGWRWLQGDQEVERLCSVHGGCDGGFWSETPTYAAHGPVLAFGLGFRPPMRGDIWPAFGFEVSVAHYDLDRLGMDPDLQDTFVSLGLNIAVGRAR